MDAGWATQGIPLPSDIECPFVSGTNPFFCLVCVLSLPAAPLLPPFSLSYLCLAKFPSNTVLSAGFFHFNSQVMF